MQRNHPNSIPNETLTSTRRLSSKERAVFDRVTSEFVHLAASDAEQLTQYAEAVVRYQTAAKETKKSSTVSIPVVNRATGNVTGEKIIRNPAFATLKEALSQMNALARRLLIDAHSAEKRQRLLTKKARALVAAETQSASSEAALANLSEEQIEEELESLRQANVYSLATSEFLRQYAIWRLINVYRHHDLSDYSIPEENAVPFFKGRPMILFPSGWNKGWMAEGTSDSSGQFPQNWLLTTWKEFRDDYYDGLMFSPFGFDASDSFSPWPGIPYAPHGMSIHGVPKLHPDDE